ncbi:MAG: hypothetical protein HAW58_00690 [Candidatus Thioglobus sp.]|nr:hypothetical protein [Candidatus Thioglobus sp.]
MKTQTPMQSFFEGFFSIYDLDPTIKIPYQNDANSIEQYWQEVGGFLQQSMNDFDNEQKAKHK